MYLVLKGTKEGWEWIASSKDEETAFAIANTAFDALCGNNAVCYTQVLELSDDKIEIQLLGTAENEIEEDLTEEEYDAWLADETNMPPFDFGVKLVKGV